MDKKLFTVGPCEMFESSLEVGGAPVPYFRNQDFSDVMLECERLFKKAAGAKDEDKFIALTSSGTGAMEAVVMNCLHSEDKAIVINGGSFGARFSKLLDIHSIDHEDLLIPFGETLTEESLARFSNRGFTSLLVNIDETSTTQLYDLDMISAFCKENNLFLVVDAISSFGADSLNFSESGIGALIVSSQKALSLAPGLSIVLVESDCYESRVIGHESGTMYFDFKDAVENGKRGQTPFTPAIPVILQLKDILERIEADGGISSWVKRTEVLAKDFRSRLESLPISLPEFPMSNAVTLIIFDDADAREVNRRLEEEYGFVLNPCGGERASRMSRVAHIGNHTIEDNEALVSALTSILK